MDSRQRLVQVIAVTGMLACFLGAGLIAPVLSRSLVERQLVATRLDRDKGMPASVALATAALGSFRGLAINVLWIRADGLQEAGHYFEANSLARWITQLQPRHVEVWGFQSWNMAWNISAASKTAGERWVWVQRGIELLRDQAIPMNPDAPRLYRDLAWIYHAKINATMDKSHLTYKANLAAEMQEILGDIAQGRTADSAIERFRPIAEAPETLDALIAEQPEVRRVLALMSEHGAEPDIHFLRMIGRVLMHMFSLDGQITGRTVDRMPPGTRVELVRAIQADRELAGLLFNHLIPHLQRRALEDVYRLDPAFMLEVMKRYGPLDWRHPASHSIYWNERGLSVTRERVLNLRATDELTIARTRLHTIHELLKNGRLTYDPVTRRVDLLPDPRFAVSFQRAHEDAVARIESEAGMFGFRGTEGAREDFVHIYENFLTTATLYAYFYGSAQNATEHYVALRRSVRDRGGDMRTVARTMEEFVTLKMGQVIEIHPTHVRQFIDAMVRRALLDGLAAQRNDVFHKFLSIAELVYQRNRHAALDFLDHAQDRTEVATFPRMVGNSFASIMTDETISVENRARIWYLAPDEIKRIVYWDVRETFHRHIAEAGRGYDPERLMLRPEGVAELDEAMEQAQERQRQLEDEVTAERF